MRRSLWPHQAGPYRLHAVRAAQVDIGFHLHAAGNVTHFGHDFGLTQLYVNSIKTYFEAETESGQDVRFHRTGSLRLATSQTELDAYRRLEAAYQTIGAPYRIVTPNEIRKLHPLLEIDGVYGAAHTPGDGHVDPTGATRAMAKSAKTRGARIKRHCPVRTMRQLGSGEWEIETAESTVRAGQVVLAASFWTRELADQLGLSLPLYPVEHHEVITGPVPGIEAIGFELPTVRGPYGPANIRQEGSGFLCGVYESNPEFWAIDGIPPEFGQELLVPDMDRLEVHLMRIMERLPSFGEAGIKAVNNGPICYTPDGCPLVGPVPDAPSLWLAAGFAAGIGTGGGSGLSLADWTTDGHMPFDLPAVNPARFSNQMSPAECLERIRTSYAGGYITPSHDESLKRRPDQLPEFLAASDYYTMAVYGSFSPCRDSYENVTGRVLTGRPPEWRQGCSFMSTRPSSVNR